MFKKKKPETRKHKNTKKTKERKTKAILGSLLITATIKGNIRSRENSMG